MNTSLDFVSVKSDIKIYTNFITRPIALMVMKNHTRYARDFGLVLQSMFQEINKHSIDNLIIDLRNNWGGDRRPGKQLIWYLTDQQEIKGFTEYVRISDYYKTQFKPDYKAYNATYQEKFGKPIPYGMINITDTILSQTFFYDISKEDSPFLLDHTLPKFKGNVYVLIGVNTFSAAATLATTIADNNLATIVGKPTGQKPTTQSGASLFKLPHTKSIVTISCAYVERPNKLKNHEIALFPDIEIYPTLVDYLSGVDVQFEYIINEINK
jgi:C-terminal processing protease CtpA/Prc